MDNVWKHNKCINMHRHKVLDISKFEIINLGVTHSLNIQILYTVIIMKEEQSYPGQRMVTSASNV
jgi:hypothetical protein